MAFKHYCFICFWVFILSVFICVSSAAIQDDNSLTVDLAIESSKKWNTHSPDDVRCYCNLPVCVSTSYMCKSEGGGCFSEVVDTDFESPSSIRTHDAYKGGRHGCLELLETKHKDKRVECENMPSKRKSSQHKEHPGSLLLCCFKDLCNHIDSPETQNILNGTRLSATLNDSPNHPSMSSTHELNMSASPGYNSNEVWFKAAIIAVPICGVVILFMLIIWAVKILRTDSFNASSKLGGPYVPSDRKTHRHHFEQVHHHHPSISLKKVPLLIHHHQHHELLSGAHTNHSSDELLKHTAVPLLVQNETGLNHSYDKKNEANAKLNTAQGHEYNLIPTKDREKTSPLLGLQKSINPTSSNNVYKNVNLTLTPAPENVQHVMTDNKLYDKQALSSVINWGHPSPSSSPV